MKKFFILTVLLYGIGLQSLRRQGLPTDKQATERVQTLYNRLMEVRQSGKALLGHHDALAYGHGWRDELRRSDVMDMTGSHPAAYFTEEVQPVLEDNKLSMIVFWRNDDRSATHHYLPYKGHSAEADFVKFCKSPVILLEKPTRASLLTGLYPHEAGID